VAFVFSSFAQTQETEAQRNKRMAWFREARFGLFIHWGVYSVPAGEYQGKTGYGEWFLEETKMPVSQYQKFAEQFNPVKFDAAQWVRLAKNAGMKYIVITSKHHDGFAMWPTAQTDWSIQNTPFKRDPLKELADACKKEGLTFCFYHSIMDWHHPDWGTRRAWNDTATGTPDMDRYTAFMKAQLKELLTQYGPLGILWFDGEWEAPWTHDRGVDLYNYVRGLQPKIIVNNRVGKARSGMAGMDQGHQRVGDYGTPEQEIPATGFGTGVDWESCMTMNNHWGYNKNDQNWKSTTVLVRNLIDCASKGGNYLLNVGPTAEGLIPAPSVQRLEEIGDWMKVNRESVYGTTASPFDKLTWGRCTQKPLSRNKTRLYLHVFDRPADGRLVLPGLANKPLKVAMLDGGKPLDFTTGNNSLTITLPEGPLNPHATVIVVDLKGKPEVIKPDPYANETSSQRDARMKWWRESRFGMFIHWGVYAVPAGVYDGKRIPGIGEWIMNHGKIPMAEYQGYAKQFNPVKFNADEWVSLAKDAGMKYIVITSKHHDGFAMFDSQASDWNIMKASPFGRDPLKELAAACRKHGLKLGFYYSQAQDWNNGGSAAGGKWDKAQGHSMDEYIDKVAVPQMREILSNYGEFPAVLWWDTPTDMNQERADKLISLLRAKPGIIHNNRLGGGYKGDTETPEQFIPATGYPGRDWETCMTLNDTWGFKSYDHNWKGTEVLIRNLVDIASKGGNYLLNVGPTAEGLIPMPSVERLKAVGQWMKVNGEAIYSTSASPFKRLPWGRCTKTIAGNTTTLYLHVFDWPADGKLLVPGLMNSATKAFLLADRKRSLDVQSTPEGMVIALPTQAPDPIASVLVVKTQGALKIENPGIAQDFDGSISLAASEATIHGDQLKFESGHERDNLGFWVDAADWADWEVKVTKPGKFDVSAEIAAEGSGSFLVSANGQTVPGKAPNTGDYGKFRSVKLGTLEISSAGKVSVAVKPNADGWHPMNLKSIRLKPVTAK
jgi:alpha-L-fucosidase